MTALEAEVSDLQSKLEALTAEKGEVDAELQAAKASIDDLESALETAQTGASTQQSDSAAAIAELKGKLEAAEAEVKRLQKEYNDAHGVAGDTPDGGIRGIIPTLREELDVANGKIQDLESQIEAALSEAGSAKGTSDARIESLEKEFAAAIKAGEEKQTELEAELAKTAAQQAELATQKTELEALRGGVPYKEPEPALALAAAPTAAGPLPPEEPTVYGGALGEAMGKVEELKAELAAMRSEAEAAQAESAERVQAMESQLAAQTATLERLQKLHDEAYGKMGTASSTPGLIDTLKDQANNAEAVLAAILDGAEKGLMVNVAALRSASREAEADSGNDTAGGAGGLFDDEGSDAESAGRACAFEEEDSDEEDTSAAAGDGGEAHALAGAGAGGAAAKPEVDMDSLFALLEAGKLMLENPAVGVFEGALVILAEQLEEKGMVANASNLRKVGPFAAQAPFDPAKIVGAIKAGTLLKPAAAPVPAGPTTAAAPAYASAAYASASADE